MAFCKNRILHLSSEIKISILFCHRRTPSPNWNELLCARWRGCLQRLSEGRRRDYSCPMADSCPVRVERIDTFEGTGTPSPNHQAPTSSSSSLEPTWYSCFLRFNLTFVHTFVLRCYCICTNGDLGSQGAEARG